MHRISIRIATTVFAAMILAATPAAAQLGIGKLTGKDKSRDEQVKKAEKAAQTYDKIKEFSTDLYEKDADFREDVEKHFDRVQQQHSQEAFDYNVAPPARPTVVNDGDRLRLRRGLYDNKIVQDYVNRIGQQLVPEDSEKLFAFRLVADPIPFADTLSTGTIYISTGLISLLDNEAQLAYVLGHEMAHVYKDHWKLKSMLELGEEEYNKKQERKRRFIGLGAGLAAAAVVGGTTRSGGDAVAAGIGGGLAGYALANIFVRGMNLDWDKVQEDEADKIAFKVALSRNYDVQVVPALYIAMQKAVHTDQRVGLGFMGSRRRLLERIANVNDLLKGEYKNEIDQKLKAAKLVGSGPDFSMVMSELKRDNGILAFYHDMFGLARSNLEYAVGIRSNDPGAHYYYAKVLKLVGRSEEDKKMADQEFIKAIQNDRRSRFYGAHLYRALYLINAKDPSQNAQIADSLQKYLNAYLGYTSEEAVISAYLPANIDDLYDYLAQAGEVNWTPQVPAGTVKRISAFTNDSGVTLPRNYETGAAAVESAPPAGGGSRLQNTVKGVGAGVGGVAGGAKGAAAGATVGGAKTPAQKQ